MKQKAPWYTAAVVLAVVGTSVTAQMTQSPVEPMAFDTAAKRHQALVKEYQENTAKIEQLTSRNQQILTELNYLSGYLDALLRVSRTLDRTGERDRLSSASRILRLPPPNWQGPAAATPTPASVPPAAAGGAPRPDRAATQGDAKAPRKKAPIPAPPSAKRVPRKPQAPAGKGK